MDIYQFAMGMEKAGREYYLKMADASPGHSGKRIYTILADEELRHYELLKAMGEGQTAPVLTEHLEEAEAVFQSLVGSGPLGEHLPGGEAYLQGIELEDKSIVYYRDKALTEEDPRARVLFLKLYFEEKKHKLLLENILEMIQEPEMQFASPELERPLTPEL